MKMTLETVLEALETFPDADITVIETRGGEIKKLRDIDRKEKATEDARALLAAAGLTFKDVMGKAKPKAAKGPTYHTGHTYQHPSDKSLTWNGKGKRPAWITTLESEGGKAVEVEPLSVKKAG